MFPIAENFLMLLSRQIRLTWLKAAFTSVSSWADMLPLFKISSEWFMTRAATLTQERCFVFSTYLYYNTLLFSHYCDRSSANTLFLPLVSKFSRLMTRQDFIYIESVLFIFRSKIPQAVFQVHSWYPCRIDWCIRVIIQFESQDHNSRRA